MRRRLFNCGHEAVELWSHRVSLFKRLKWYHRWGIGWVVAWFLVPAVTNEETKTGTELQSITARLVAGFEEVDPAHVMQYFYLQADTCNFDLGFSCAPDGAPAGAFPRSERPTLDPEDPASVQRARDAVQN